MQHQRNLTSLGIGFLLLAGLSGCTWLIPDDPSTLRYNTVMGERHVPSGNKKTTLSPEALAEEADQPILTETQMTPVAPAIEDAPPPMVAQNAVPVTQVVTAPLPPMTAPVPSTTIPGLPPVDTLTQTRAEHELAMQRRQTPMENTPYTTAENAFTHVPQSPPTVGADAPQNRLNNVRRDLESERSRADAAHEQLNRDAASEPSLLNEPPRTIVAPTGPNGTIVPPHSSLGATETYVALPPPPPLSGMAMPQTANASFDPMAPVPSTQPVYSSAMPVNRAAAPGPVAMGDFDPLAVRPAAPAPVVTYASSGFMAQSRYKR